MRTIAALYVDNAEATPATSTRSGAVFNPATGEQAASVGFASADDTAAAVASAAKAFPAWRDTSLAKRTNIMFKWRSLVDARREELARALVSEHGKVISDARGEVQRGLEVIDFACAAGELLKGDFSENVSTAVDSYSYKQPLGVVVSITPFNFPAMVPLWTLPVALACGNTIVLKPSEKDPTCGMMLAALWAEAGGPPGTFNVVNGDKEAVDALLEAPAVKAVTFVGSTPIARYVNKKATENGKRCTALGGAKNHMIVCADANMDAAAAGAIAGGFGSAGERCMAVSVLVCVGEGTAERLLPKIQELMKGIKVKDGQEEDAGMGPLVTRVHRDSVAGWIAKGAEEGATVVEDGRGLVKPDGGFWLGPTLLDHVRPEMAVYKHEIFGPVLSTVRTATFEEAIELINACPFANGTSVYTSSGRAARRFTNAIEVGMVGVNVPVPVPVAMHSFGGWKDSELGGGWKVTGKLGVAFMTREKVITTRWPDDDEAQSAKIEALLAMPTQK